MHLLLFYEYVSDIAEKRAPHRAAHLQHIKASFDAGELIIGGALADPLDGAVLAFRGDSVEVGERFAQNDPYVLNGLVTRWTVRKWMTVIGDNAQFPS